MAGTELIIDDDYVNEMADFLNTRATNLQEGIDRYIQILDNIRRDAINRAQRQMHWTHSFRMQKIYQM